MHTTHEAGGLPAPAVWPLQPRLARLLYRSALSLLLLTARPPPLPPRIHRRFQKKVAAGADCLSLRTKAPYFYTAGLAVNKHLRDPELARFLMDTFRARYTDLVSRCLNGGSGSEALTLQAKMCREEQQCALPLSFLLLCIPRAAVWLPAFRHRHRSSSLANGGFSAVFVMYPCSASLPCQF